MGLDDICTVEVIQADEAGLDFYLNYYKPFRLLSLQSDPSAFGSTYAREQAFEDEQWRARLCRPDARTFIAREREQDPSILSSISLIGPNAVSTQLKSQLGLTGRVLSWELNGVFTLPAARRRGIAAAVITAAKKHALKEAVCKSSACLLTVVVYTDDRAAKSWYEKMGFKVYQESQDQGRPTSALAMLQQGL